MASRLTPAESDAAMSLLRALVDEIKASAHDPEVIHLVAEKLHKGIDALEKMLVGDKPGPAA